MNARTEQEQEVDVSADSPWLAVVGMACRFPGAASPEEFWEKLAAGVESISALGSPDSNGYQAACGVIENADRFDAAFFGYSPREALLLDPQHRVFLECAWAGLEDAGYDPSRYPGAIGVYAGSSETRYARALMAQRHRLGGTSEFQIRLATGMDFLTTRVAYKLGLTGPAITVQTGCSTSLVAIHLAAQALLTGDCDMALAGGVTVHVPADPGEYTEGGILSLDGHCRAFDAAANGTVGGDGAGVVVLRRLADALADGDTIRAVLRGSAVNNDGFDKIGYTAPSIEGQARVIRAAQLIAEAAPETISYIEAHGTGTPLGDPIELAALTQAFRHGTDRRGFCRIGSVKTNIGHTDAAAGVAGFIKTVLALQHREVPPSLHFTAPNPQIDLAASPFVVPVRRTPWEATGTPRRAGVSSLGIGGTNAHAVLEEAPAMPPTGPGRPCQLLVLSAKTRSALDAASGRLLEQLNRNPSMALADAAWTLQTGRKEQRHRRFVVAERAPDAAARLAEAISTGLAGDAAEERRPQVVFLFPGQGGQHIGMAEELYRHEPAFAAAVDECAELARAPLGLDLRSVLYPAGDPGRAAQRLNSMTVGQVSIFVVEYALARLWTAWGVRPDAVLGHSLGAYAAACTAGVFSLPDAVRLVVARGQLLDTLSEGAMLAVPLPEQEVRGLLGDELSVAAINAAAQCVISGPAARIDALAAALSARGVDARRLHIPAGAHSTLVEPILAEFERRVSELRLQAPSIPWVSETTGTWVTGEEVTRPSYWTAHLRQPVRFADALTTVLRRPGQGLVEVGPGRTLITLARQHPGIGSTLTVPTLSHAAESVSDLSVALTAAGRLWAAGVPLHWAGLHEGERRRRVSLPTYPFQGQRYRVEAPESAQAAPAEAEPIRPPEPPRDDERPHGLRQLTEREHAVCKAFAEILGVTGVGPSDNFFDLGGDSLIATQLTAWVRRAFQVTVSVREVLTRPTPGALAALLDSRLSTPSLPQKES
ncbi:MAG: type I polyketide synthase [Hyalangium sp.]|uniref:type I polyketide synthase n=1 Tax=Hyalangium sp. TaxID=2028555 RepID=UPI00389A9C3F